MGDPRRPGSRSPNFTSLNLRPWAGLLMRFGLVGVINTAVGFGVAAVLDVGLHLAPAGANAAGYMVGIPLGFVLSRTFVFRHKAAAAATGPRYLIVVALSFALNQGVLRLAGLWLGPGALPHLAAQLAGMATYSATIFLACRFWVFRAPGRP